MAGEPHDAKRQLDRRACSTCGRDDAKLKFCAICVEVGYCSRKCQLDDWKSHKTVCNEEKPPSDNKEKGKEKAEASQSALALVVSRRNTKHNADAEDSLPSIIQKLRQYTLYDCAFCGWSKDHNLVFCICTQVKYCSEYCRNRDLQAHRPACEYVRKMYDALCARRATAPIRQVYVPKKAKNKCSHCRSRKGREHLKLCPCFQMRYCSEACQQASWKTHKTTCGKTDSPDIEAFYPLLAYLVERSHFNELKPLHRAFTHTILNPGRLEYLGSGVGFDAMTVFLAPSTRRHTPGSPEWWPNASADDRARLAQRIVHEGFVLPIIASVLVALLCEMYTTTSAPDSAARRVRLRYRSEPIADFGICAGTVRVTNRDRLQYMDARGWTTPGQDPQDHYWMYFLTARGEEVLLDCAMVPFNFDMVLFVLPYVPRAHWGTPMGNSVPAVFQERLIRNNTPSMYIERTRMSVLRDAELQKAAENSARGFTVEDEDRVVTFMEKLARRHVMLVEREFMVRLLNDHILTLRKVVQGGEYREFPERPITDTLTRPRDPESSITFKAEAEADWNRIQQENRKNKKRGNAWPAPPL